mgnify:CR=1 FL=1
MNTLALIGAGGKMGCRITDRLRGSAYTMHYIEPAAAGFGLDRADQVDQHLPRPHHAQAPVVAEASAGERLVVAAEDLGNDQTLRVVVGHASGIADVRQQDQAALDQFAKVAAVEQLSAS